MMPTSGTSSCAVGGSLRTSIINSSMPSSAATAATDIFASRGAAGSSSAISSSAKVALWLAPTMEGSTKRFFSRICIIMPATPMDAPVSTMANVRGRRLVIMTWVLSFRLPEKSFAQENSATPTDRLTANRTRVRATVIRVRGLAVMGRCVCEWVVGGAGCF